MKPGITLEAQLLVLCAVLVIAAAAAGAALMRWSGSFTYALLFGSALLLPLSLLLVRRFMSPINRHLRVLIDGVSSLRDGDFSISLVQSRRDELGELAAAYNGVGDVLRSERQNLYQRELLLDTVIQSSPQALVLTDAVGHVMYSNTAARKLFHQGHRMEGLTFAAILENAPRSLYEAATAELDGLYSVEMEHELEILHVSRNRFTLNTREHRLYQFRQLTRELTRQELATWKKVIRVISHELNNSLAPISSLAHSGRLIVKQEQPRPELLDDIFATIEERSARLKQFLENYARFAKLPQPRPEAVHWSGFLASLGRTLGFQLLAPPPLQAASFDPSQLQQVLINLLKNAHESGSPPEDVAVDVRSDAGQTVLRMLDRGPGMSETVLSSALLPFYSTKTEGTGLGLTLCREIIEAHGGRMSLANRDGGGLEVRLTLPRSRSQG